MGALSWEIGKSLVVETASAVVRGKEKSTGAVSGALAKLVVKVAPNELLLWVVMFRGLVC